MNKNIVRVLLVAGGVIVLILGIFLLTPTRAKATFANLGIPARCYGSFTTTADFLTCVPPSGAETSFVGAQRVPAGYYFLVTDVMVTPLGGTTGDALTDFSLEDCYGTSNIQSINRFRNLEGATYGQHFNAPMWTLLPDHRLQVVVNGGSQQAFEIRVNGLLVTNINYLPMVVSP